MDEQPPIKPHESQESIVTHMPCSPVRRRAPASIELVAVGLLLGILLSLGAPLIFTKVVATITSESPNTSTDME